MLPVTKNRSHGEHGAKGRTVLPHEDDLLLEFAFLDGLPKQARDERRDVLRHMEHRDGHLADNLVWRPSEQVGGVGRVLLHDAVRVAGDDRGPRFEGRSGHRQCPGAVSHGRRGGSRGCVMPMKPTCFPSRYTGRTVSRARKTSPSFRRSVTSSSNFPFSTASFSSRGTRVGTFSGRWKVATLSFPTTSAGDHPNRSPASAAYSCTIPCISHVMTDVCAWNGFSAMGLSEEIEGPHV